MFFKKKDGPFRANRDIIEKSTIDEKNQFSDPDREEAPKDIMEYNSRQHEIDMLKRRASIERNRRNYAIGKEIKEKIFEERRDGNESFVGDSINHTNCNSRTRTVVFQNLKVYKYPAIITYDYGEYTGYAFKFENCTGRGYQLQECLNEIGIDVAYPLQEFYNDFGYIPQYTREDLMHHPRVAADVKNGAKIKLVDVEIDTSLMRND